MVELTRDGKSSILIKQPRFLRKELTRPSDSMSIDHSILSQDFQLRELLKLKETTTSLSRDTRKEELLNNGGSIQFPRQSDLITGRTTAWKFHQMEEPMMLESQVQSIQDGGSCSDSKELIL